MQKVMIAMSGGVDSSVAAYLAQAQGYECIGGIMQLFPGAEGSIADAQAAADRLQIPLHIFDASREFTRQVIEPFISDYESGLTPNPCFVCNCRLKFSWLLDRALELGCDYLVTGHYARVIPYHTGPRLFRAPEPEKDQSYFLAGLTRQQLSHCLFPLGEMSKNRVRLLAHSLLLGNAEKKDSQDICFIPDGDYKAFMEAYTGKRYPCGDFLDLQGNKVGQHCGAVGYTLGQRKGLGLAMGSPVYVCGKNMAENTVTVGPESALYTTSVWAERANYIPFEKLTAPMSVTAKTRSRHPGQPATVYPLDDGAFRVDFQSPQRAVTPGQLMVLYDGDLVIGSGIITKTA